MLPFKIRASLDAPSDDRRTVEAILRSLEKDYALALTMDHEGQIWPHLERCTAALQLALAHWQRLDTLLDQERQLTNELDSSLELCRTSLSMVLDLTAQLLNRGQVEEVLEIQRVAEDAVSALDSAEGY